jgi:hypothetical protein
MLTRSARTFLARASVTTERTPMFFLTVSYNGHAVEARDANIISRAQLTSLNFTVCCTSDRTTFRFTYNDFDTRQDAIVRLVRYFGDVVQLETTESKNP